MPVRWTTSFYIFLQLCFLSTYCMFGAERGHVKNKHVKHSTYYGYIYSLLLNNWTHDERHWRIMDIFKSSIQMNDWIHLYNYYSHLYVWFPRIYCLWIIWTRARFSYTNSRCQDTHIFRFCQKSTETRAAAKQNNEQLFTLQLAFPVQIEQEEENTALTTFGDWSNSAWRFVHQDRSSLALVIVAGFDVHKHKHTQVNSRCNTMASREQIKTKLPNNNKIIHIRCSKTEDGGTMLSLTCSIDCNALNRSCVVYNKLNSAFTLHMLDFARFGMARSGNLLESPR